MNKFERLGKNTKIKKKLYIGKNVTIGENVEIGDWSKIENNVTIENDITIGSNVLIGNGVSISEKCRIENNVTIGYINLTKKKDYYEDFKTEIGKNCFIGFGAVIRAGTILGKQCIVGANAVVKGHFPDYSVIAGAPARIIKRYDLKSKKWRETDEKGDFKYVGSDSD